MEKNIDENDTNAFRYCGEYFDKETGTIYLRARYYNPGTGRFISRDSYAGKLNDPLSLNLYTYCANNPVLYFDPTGHIAVVDDAALLVLAAAFVVTSAANIASQPQVQKGLSQAANSLTSSIKSTASGIHDILTSSGSSEYYGIKENFKSTCENPYLAPWIGTMSIQEAWEKNWSNSDTITDTKTKTITQKKSSGHTVYKLIDDDGQVQYIGRTSDVAATIRRHGNNIFRSEFELVPMHEGLSYEQARGLEQHYIEYYRTINKYHKANNQINGVNPKKRDKYDYYMDIASHYLLGETYVGG